MESLGQLGGGASAARAQPPLPGVGPDDYPLILSAVQAEPVSLAEYLSGPCLVEISQEYPHVPLLELLEGRSHFSCEALCLDELYRALIQIGHQSIVHLENRAREGTRELETTSCRFQFAMLITRYKRERIRAFSLFKRAASGGKSPFIM